MKKLINKITGLLSRYEGYCPRCGDLYLDKGEMCQTCGWSEGDPV